MSTYDIENNRVNLGLGIYVYKNVVTDDEEFLKNLEDAFNTSIVLDDIETIKKANEDKPESVDRDLETFTIPYKLSKVLLDTHHTPKQAFNNIVANKIYNVLDIIEKDYCFNIYNMPLPPIHEPYYILKYTKNNFFDNHIDATFTHPRVVSLLYYLNSDYEGGEIEFPELGILYKPESNDVLVFPSNFIYMHNVHPIKNGTRYVIVTWLLNSEIITK